MNIVLISRYFPPEIGTAANLFCELAEGLKKKGHTVTVLTGFPWYNIKEVPKKYSWKIYMKENIKGVEIIRLKFPIFGPMKLKLAVGHITMPFATCILGLFMKKPDIVYVYSPPIFLGITGWVIKILKKTKFALGVQDLHPKCYIDQGVLKNKFLIYILEGIEKFCYRKADIITVHSSGNKDYIVKEKSIPETKVEILHNWLDTDIMTPLPRKNEFSDKYQLNDKFIVGYAGTLGMSQGCLSIVEAAKILAGEKGIEFFIVGDGIEKKEMVEKTKEYGLTNIRYLEMQTKEMYPLVVAASDVGLVTLNKKVKTPVVPSKILSMMAAARPVLSSMPLEGDAPELIKQSNCGICIEAENPKLLAETILYLYNNPGKCKEYSESGRKYVVAEFSLKKAVENLEKIFEKA